LEGGRTRNLKRTRPWGGEGKTKFRGEGIVSERTFLSPGKKGGSKSKPAIATVLASQEEGREGFCEETRLSVREKR